MVDVIGLLLRGLFVLGADRLEPDNLVRARKDIHQARHQPFDGVGHIGRDRLGPAFLRRHVLVHVAEVVVHRLGAVLGELGRRSRPSASAAFAWAGGRSAFACGTFRIDFNTARFH
jgi:hypothetical protein